MSYKKVCSLCGKEHTTVNRHMFDGMCTDCTTIALYDESAYERAKKRNRELKIKSYE